jgi:hypothetical protein
VAEKEEEKKKDKKEKGRATGGFAGLSCCCAAHARELVRALRVLSWPGWFLFYLFVPLLFSVLIFRIVLDI